MRHGKDRVLRLAHRSSGEQVVKELVPGVVMRLDLGEYIQRSIYYYGFYEPATVAVVKSLLRPSMVMLDVGAHVGQYTLLGAAAVRPKGQVIAFEPEPENRGRLIDNIRLSDLTNVNVLPLALSDSDGQTEFFLPPTENRGMGSVRKTSPKLSSAAGLIVTTARLDSLWPRLGCSRLDFIKIDTEGAELPILEGGARTLRTFRPTLVVEANDTNTAAFGYTTLDLEAFLIELGYELYLIEPQRLKPYHRVGSISANLLCRPKETS